MSWSFRISDIQAFITYSKQFTQPITQTANIVNIIQSAIAAAERVFELLAANGFYAELYNSQFSEKAAG